jgi:hypothetical protein
MGQRTRAKPSFRSPQARNFSTVADDRAPEAVSPLIAFLVDAPEVIEVPVQELVERGILGAARLIDRAGAGIWGPRA